MNRRDWKNIKPGDILETYAGNQRVVVKVYGKGKGQQLKIRNEQNSEFDHNYICRSQCFTRYKKVIK